MTTPKPPSLPKEIVEKDLKYPDYRDKDQLIKEWEDRTFELWYTTSLGWVIPTLLIRHSRRAERADRTYATTLDGKACRVGLGPHVLRRVTVYVRESRRAALQKFLDLRRSGQVTSNQIRDRISSRRAQGQVMRAEGRTSWRWDV